MALPISPGEILEVAKFAYDLWASFKAAKGKFEKVSKELYEMRTLIQIVHLDCESPESIINHVDDENETIRRKLRVYIENCEQSLSEAEALLERYKSMSIPDRVHWIWRGDAEVADMVSNLSTYTTHLNTFINTLTNKGVGKVNANLLKGFETILKGIDRIEEALENNDGDGKVAVKEIMRDIRRSGVSQEEATKYNDIIEGYAREVSQKQDLPTRRAQTPDTSRGRDPDSHLSVIPAAPRGKSANFSPSDDERRDKKGPFLAKTDREQPDYTLECWLVHVKSADLFFSFRSREFWEKEKQTRGQCKLRDMAAQFNASSQASQLANDHELVDWVLKDSKKQEKNKDFTWYPHAAKIERKTSLHLGLGVEKQAMIIIKRQLTPEAKEKADKKTLDAKRRAAAKNLKPRKVQQEEGNGEREEKAQKKGKKGPRQEEKGQRPGKQRQEIFEKEKENPPEGIPQEEKDQGEAQPQEGKGPQEKGKAPKKDEKRQPQDGKAHEKKGPEKAQPQEGNGPQEKGKVPKKDEKRQPQDGKAHEKKGPEKAQPQEGKGPQEKDKAPKKDEKRQPQDGKAHEKKGPEKAQLRVKKPQEAKSQEEKGQSEEGESQETGEKKQPKGKKPQEEKEHEKAQPQEAKPQNEKGQREEKKAQEKDGKSQEEIKQAMAQPEKGKGQQEKGKASKKDGKKQPQDGKFQEKEHGKAQSQGEKPHEGDPHKAKEQREEGRAQQKDLKKRPQERKPQAEKEHGKVQPREAKPQKDKGQREEGETQEKDGKPQKEKDHGKAQPQEGEPDGEKPDGEKPHGEKPHEGDPHKGKKQREEGRAQQKDLKKQPQERKPQAEKEHGKVQPREAKPQKDKGQREEGKTQEKDGKPQKEKDHGKAQPQEEEPHGRKLHEGKEEKAQK